MEARKCSSKIGTWNSLCWPKNSCRFIQFTNPIADSISFNSFADLMRQPMNQIFILFSFYEFGMLVEILSSYIMLSCDIFKAFDIIIQLASHEKLFVFMFLSFQVIQNIHNGE